MSVMYIKKRGITDRTIGTSRALSLVMSINYSLSELLKQENLLLIL